MRILGSSLLLLASIASLPPAASSPAPAPGPPPATLRGRVTDLAGHPLAGVTVRLTEGDAAREATSVKDGSFLLEWPSPGRPLLEASLDGYATVRVDDLVLTAGEVRTVALALRPGILVRGTVRDPEGKPVGGATLAVDLSRQRPATLRPGADDEGALRKGRAEATTAEDGSFALGVLPRADGYLLEVRHPGAAPLALPLDLERRPPQGPLAIVLPRGASIRARVLGPDDRPVEGALARATDLSRPEAAGGVTVEATSDGEGTVRLAPLAAGRWRIEILPPAGLRSWHGPLALKAGQTLDLGVVRSRPGVAVTGRVVSKEDGDPVAGAKVRALRSLNGGSSLERTATSDEEGRFELGGLAEGRYELHSEAKPEFVPLVAEGIEAPAGGLTLELERAATLEGSAIADDGAPLEQLTVVARPVNPRAPSSHAGTPEVVDRESGRFRIEGIAPGRFVVHARARGRLAARSAELDLAAGERREGLVLTLERGGLALSGRVVDRASRAGLSGATVTPLDAPEQATTTASDGSFSIEGLTAGQLRVAAAHPDYASQVLALVASADRTEPVEIPLGPGATVEGSVSAASGAPVAGARIEAVPDGGEFAPRTAVTGADGRYRIEHVPAGSGRVARAGGGSRIDDREEKAALFEDGGALVVDFLLGGRVVGRVTRDGLPIAGVPVTLTDGSFEETEQGHAFGYQAATGWTDPDGRFTLENVRPGRKLAAIATDGQRTLRVVTLADAPEMQLEIALPSRPVTGTTIDARTGAGVSASIRADASDGASDGYSWQVVQSRRADDGSASMLTVGGGDGEETRSGPDGSFRLFVDERRGWSIYAFGDQGNASFDLPPGGPYEELSLVLTRRAVLEVAVAGPGGSPLAQVSGCFHSVDGRGFSTSCSLNELAGETLRFHATADAKGTVWAVAPGYALASADVAGLTEEGDGPANRLELTLVPGTALRLLLPVGSPLRLTGVVRESDGRALLEGLRALELVATESSDTEPAIAVRGLAAGPHRFELSGEEGTPSVVVSGEARLGQVVELAVPR